MTESWILQWGEAGGLQELAELMALRTGTAKQREGSPKPDPDRQKKNTVTWCCRTKRREIENFQA